MYVWYVWYVFYVFYVLCVFLFKNKRNTSLPFLFFSCVLLLEPCENTLSLFLFFFLCILPREPCENAFSLFVFSLRFIARTLREYLLSSPSSLSFFFTCKPCENALCLPPAEHHNALTKGRPTAKQSYIGPGPTSVCLLLGDQPRTVT